MLKTILISFLFVLGVILTPGTVMAEDVNCVQNYGQPTVCGVKTVHVPVETDWKDVNLKAVGFGLIFASGILFYLSKKVRPRLI